MHPQEPSFAAALPPALAALAELSRNLRWTWDATTQELFESLDAKAWNATGRDPMRLLASIPNERWAALAGNPDIVAATAQAHTRLQSALTDDRWFQTHRHSALELVAYFSPEFGLSETLPQYAGGLGILAGDHLKAASDLGIPLVAVGLLYDEGYFRQQLDATGLQTERYPALDPGLLPINDTGVEVTVELADDPVRVHVWRVQVGRVPLFLLDTNVVGNSTAAATITDRLYGGDSDHRLRQEIVLGIGGVRALRALGLHPQVFHTNEGHAGFLSLERVRELVTATGCTFAEATDAVRAGGLFTTHTPVPAGIDRFTRAQMAMYFTKFAQSCGCSFDELMAIGQAVIDSAGDDPADRPFNMAVMGLRLAGRANGVAQLHGRVSRQMFADLWPERSVDEVPIGAITNGVHAATWVGNHMAPLLTSAIGSDWGGVDATAWRLVDELSDRELWSARRGGRTELVDFVRDRAATNRFDPEALTIGFARRFATYKRATLLLTQPERLRAMLLDAGRPVQFVFAGKAHPADTPGKEMIRAIEQFARDHKVATRFVFLQDYDMAIARILYHGCDVWLNNPRRPLEACGTSGMKAALNGCLNCSILDGWWDECYDGSNGWAITSAEDEADPAVRDRREADSLFELLEREIVPLFYDRDDDLPRGWMAMIKRNWASLGPFVTAARMVRDYTTMLYEPCAADVAATRPVSDR